MSGLFFRFTSGFATLVVLATLAGAEASADSCGHHVPGRDDPYTNCGLCHGADLQGLVGRSCYACHERNWPGGELPPIADSGGPYAGSSDELVSFDGSGSIDVDGVIRSYAWDFGDGSTATGPRPTHVFAADGIYNVILTIIDDRGNSDVSTTEAEIVTIIPNLPPLAVAGGPYAGEAGVPVSFDASASTDMDGTIVAYSWDFGDGQAGTGVTPTHTYADAGFFMGSLTVTDDGGATNTVVLPVAVAPAPANSPPVADAGGPYSGAVGQVITLDASATVDPDGDALTFIWDFGDGSIPPFPGSNPVATHAYTEAGTYTVQVIVTDGATLPVIAQTEVVITEETDPPPTNGEGWSVLLPLQGTQLFVSFEDYFGFLWVQTTHSDGSVSFGIGFEFDSMILWMDMSGSVFVGSVDHSDETMMGIMFAGPEESSVWFAERL